MCVCVCVCVCDSVCECMYACMYVCMSVCVCVPLRRTVPFASVEDASMPHPNTITCWD
jgi:hypothetical protein